MNPNHSLSDQNPHAMDAGGQTRYNILGFMFGPVLTDKEIIDIFPWITNITGFRIVVVNGLNKLEKIANAILASSDGKMYLNFEDVEVMKYHNIKLGDAK